MTTITLAHQLITPGEPPLYAATEREVRDIGKSRLPRTSSVLMLRTHSRTQEESWEFLGVVDPADHR